ncbi:MAG: hypothetical protein EOP83_31540 [Verrucomicrobiaceae bacterium]|nr:MAG: hypothetical protein EOP83_31540 [Verrucomicrobiaceae bacterium]
MYTHKGPGDYLSALALASCGTPQVINRENIDFILAKKPSPLDKARTALFPNQTERAFAQERQADLVVFYRGSGEMRIRSLSGKPVDDDSPADFPSFLDRQREKSLVVVIIEKQVWAEEEMARHLAYLNNFFLGHGYRRVVVQQARGNGRPIHSDTARPGSLRPKFQRRWDR